MIGFGAEAMAVSVGINLKVADYLPALPFDILITCNKALSSVDKVPLLIGTQVQGKLQIRNEINRL